MRTLKISLLVFILSTTISAQWFQQNSGTTSTLRGIQFVNEQVGWTHTFHEIYKTTNGGLNWQLQSTHSVNIIDKILFNNEDVGWFQSQYNVGAEVRKTIDGGESWARVFYVTGTKTIWDIEFINPDTGWFVGAVDFGYLFYATTDGGTTWMNKTVSPNYFNWLSDIEVIDNMNLIVLGVEILFKTTDGGNTWQEIPVANFDIRSLQFFNMNLGWAREPYAFSGTGKLFKTTDGGYTWILQVEPIDCYHFITPQIGWYTNGNEIYHSTNSGSSWSLQNSNTSNLLTDIFFIDINNGWAVGNNGTVYYTSNGGIPVELISFTVTANAIKVILNWSTATEINNSGFEILSATKEDDWNEIGFVPGHGTTTETQHYSFTDNDVNPGKYQYKLKQIDYDGTFEYSQVVEVEVSFVNEFALSQNYPNPFNSVTKIKFEIPGQTVNENALVTLKVYDILGREIVTLVNEEKPAGEYEVEFNAVNLPSGIYFYLLKAGEFIETRKMLLLK